MFLHWPFVHFAFFKCNQVLITSDWASCKRWATRIVLSQWAPHECGLCKRYLRLYITDRRQLCSDDLCTLIYFHFPSRWATEARPWLKVLSVLEPKRRPKLPSALGGGPLRSSNHQNQQLLAALWLLYGVKGRFRCDMADFGLYTLSRLLTRNREAFDDIKSIKHICLDLAWVSRWHFSAMTS